MICILVLFNAQSKFFLSYAWHMHLVHLLHGCRGIPGSTKDVQTLQLYFIIFACNKIKLVAEIDNTGDILFVLVHV